MLIQPLKVFDISLKMMFCNWNKGEKNNTDVKYNLFSSVPNYHLA